MSSERKTIYFLTQAFDSNHGGTSFVSTRIKLFESKGFKVSHLQPKFTFAPIIKTTIILLSLLSPFTRQQIICLLSRIAIPDDKNGIFIISGFQSLLLLHPRFWKRAKIYSHDIDAKYFLLNSIFEKNPIKKILFFVDAIKVFFWELIFFTFFPHFFSFLSDRDRRFATRLTKNKFTLISQVVWKLSKNTSKIPPTTNEINLVFMGPGSFPPNRFALNQYLRDIHPKIIAAFPNIKVYVTGYGWNDVEVSPGIKYLGYLSTNKFNELLRNCSYLIAPYFMSTGVKIKVLDAIVQNVHVVGTPQCAIRSTNYIDKYYTDGGGDARAYSQNLLNSISKMSLHPKSIN